MKFKKGTTTRLIKANTWVMRVSSAVIDVALFICACHLLPVFELITISFNIFMVDLLN